MVKRREKIKVKRAGSSSSWLVMMATEGTSRGRVDSLDRTHHQQTPMFQLI